MNAVVTTTSVYPPCTDQTEVLRRLHGIGYTGLDLAFDYCVQETDYPFMTDAYEDWARSLRAQADALGVRYSHGHAPFDASGRGDIVERTLRCAELLGIRYLVVHPIWRDADGNILHDREEFLSVNTQAILPLLPEAARHGVVLLSENLLWGASVDAENISALVSRVDSPWFGWCYDTGHAKALGRTPDALYGCIPPLSLHIQDNHGRTDGLYDDHLIPGDGKIDWKRLMDILRETGYPGDVVLEAHHQPLEAKDEAARQAILAELLVRAQKLRTYLEH